MGGKAVNGWRFWSVQGAEAEGQRKEARSPKRRPAKSKRLDLPRPESEGDSGGSEPLVLSGLHEGLRHRRRRATGSLSGRPPRRRPGADGGSGPSGGSKRVGADDAPRRGPFGGLSCRWDVVSSWA